MNRQAEPLSFVSLGSAARALQLENAVCRKESAVYQGVIPSGARNLLRYSRATSSKRQWSRSLTLRVRDDTALEHPFAALVDDATRAKLNVGPIEQRGNEFVPNNSQYRTTDFRQTTGPSVRVVVDVGNWDTSGAISHPGHPGDPDNPHYRDLAPMWRNGSIFLCYTPGKLWRLRRRRRSHLCHNFRGVEGVFMFKLLCFKDLLQPNPPRCAGQSPGDSRPKECKMAILMIAVQACCIPAARQQQGDCHSFGYYPAEREQALIP